uniref:Adenosine 3'-phospho 5'-phosphosulfate transporter 1 n=1 Tax=Anas platyrhynchos TaxID=8839 RepID=A0A8B9SX98_ANAPL
MAAGEGFPPALQDAWGDFWLFRFFVNAAGYASIVVPGFLLIQYFKRKNYLETGRGICFPVIKSCVFGSEVKSAHPDDGSLPPRAEPAESSTARQVLKLLFCAAGLQASYLTWGVLQERVMTRTYGATETDPGEKFKDSQFLVFMNRILAFTVAGLYCALTKQPRHGAPMYKYSFASLSNILSSWCQYEALKYISFPTQVLAKASKVIPVMMMGKLVSRKSYEYWEYLTAALISVGVSMFLLSSAPHRHASYRHHFLGRGAAGRLHRLRQLHLQLAGRPLRLQDVPRADDVRRQRLLLPLHGGLAAGAGRPAGVAALHGPPLGVRGARRAAVGVLGLRPALHLLHHQPVRRRRLHHHHDAPPGLRHPPLLPHLRPHRHRGGRAGRRRCLPGPLPPRLRPQPHEEAQQEAAPRRDPRTEGLGSRGPSELCPLSHLHRGTPPRSRVGVGAGWTSDSLFQLLFPGKGLRRGQAAAAPTLFLCLNGSEASSRGTGGNQRGAAGAPAPPTPRGVPPRSD